MTTINNFLRDCFHLVPGAAQAPWAASTTPGSSVLMSSSGIVNQTVGHASYGPAASFGAGSYWATGILMSPTVVDDTPYRIKAYVGELTGVVHLFIGYAPAAPTGSSDTITKAQYFPLAFNAGGETNCFDELILMPGISPGETDYGKAIAFGILVAANSNPYISMNMSVQNLAKTSPKFAASMS